MKEMKELCRAVNVDILMRTLLVWTSSKAHATEKGLNPALFPI